MNMSEGFPTYSHSARLGEKGVNIVAKIVSDDFKWLFKRNHNEHDFGIDGQIELISDNGAVTGQMIAVQIKCGTSFFKEKNKWGYVYRGEKKHFNYLSMYPIPILIIICNPDTNEVLWAHFEPESVDMLDEGWKTTIPYENALISAKEFILSLVGPLVDKMAELEKYWQLNKLIMESDRIIYALHKNDVEQQNTCDIRDFFDRIQRTRELADHCQGRVEISFDGYDDDERDLYVIPEVRKFVTLLDTILPEILVFAPRIFPTFTLQLFAFCQSYILKYEPSKSRPGLMFVKPKMKDISEFIWRHTEKFNEVLHWLKMPIQEQEQAYYDIFTAIGVVLPERFNPKKRDGHS